MTIAAGLIASASYVTAKVVAVTNGPSGVGLLGASLGAIAFVIAVANAGISSAIPAAIRRDKRRVVALSVLSYMTALTFFLSALATALLLMLARGIEEFAAVGTGEILWLGFAGFVGVQTVLVATLGAVFISPTHSVMVRLSAAVVATGTATALIVLQPSIPIPMALGLGAVLGSVTISLFALAFRRISDDSAVPGECFSWKALLRLCGEMGFATLGTSLALALFPLIFFAGLGPFDAGLLRAALSVALILFYVGDSWIVNSFYPALAGVAGSRSLTADTLGLMRRRLLQVLTPMALLIAVASPLLLRVLFTEEFAGMSFAVAVLTLSSLIRTITHMNLAVMAANRLSRRQIMTEWFFGLVLLVVTASVFVLQWNLTAYLFAYLFATVVGVFISEALLRSSGVASFFSIHQVRG